MSINFKNNFNKTLVQIGSIWKTASHTLLIVGTGYTKYILQVIENNELADNNIIGTKGTLEGIAKYLERAQANYIGQVTFD